MQCDAIRGQSRGGDVDCSNVGNSGERGRRHRRRRSGSCGQLMLLLHSPDRLRASDMEVPDWGTAPEEDYPSLLASDNTPASDNARKKAKRKQKQQQEHLQHLMHVPVHVVSTSTLSGQFRVFAGHMPNSPTLEDCIYKHRLGPFKQACICRSSCIQETAYTAGASHVSGTRHNPAFCWYTSLSVLLVVPLHTPNAAIFCIGKS